MSKAVLDIQKGDNYNLINLEGKDYVATDKVAPFSAVEPVEYFTLDSESNQTPISCESHEATSLTLKSFIVDLGDTIFCTDGTIYHGITD